MRGVFGAAALVVAVGLVGCGEADPHNKQPVSGTVKLKGQPVKEGQIFFEPAAGQQVAMNASIIDGAFKLARDAGLSPGKYSWKLLVLEKKANTAADDGDAGGPAPKNLAKGAGGTFEVVAGQDNKLDIAVP